MFDEAVFGAEMACALDALARVHEIKRLDRNSHLFDFRPTARLHGGGMVEADMLMYIATEHWPYYITELIRGGDTDLHDALGLHLPWTLVAFPHVEERLITLRGELRDLIAAAQES